MKKIGLLSLALIIALCGLGTGYAAWSNDLFIQANLTTAEYPSVATGDATEITQTSAVLNGDLISKGTADKVSVYFDYGLTTSYGSSSNQLFDVKTGIFSIPISGLAAGTLYNFRAVALGSNGITAYGENKTFTTLSAGVTGFYDLVEGPVDPPSTGTEMKLSGEGTLTMTAIITVGDNGHIYHFPATCNIRNYESKAIRIETVTITLTSPFTDKSLSYSDVTGALVQSSHTVIPGNSSAPAGITFISPDKGMTKKGKFYTATVTFTYSLVD